METEYNEYKISIVLVIYNITSRYLSIKIQFQNKMLFIKPYRLYVRGTNNNITASKVLNAHKKYFNFN